MATFREVKRTKGRSVEARVYGPAGERISRTFQTKEAAKQWARKMEVDRDEGTFRDPRANKYTVSDVARSWFQSIDVEATTRVDYDSLWRTHVVSKWGHRQLDSVLPSEIKQWVKALRDSGLSHSRIRKSHLVLAMIFDHAVEDRHLDRSPVTRLRLRKDARLTKPMIALTIHQLPQVALAVRDSLVVGPGLSNLGYDVLVMLAADTGLRPGELRAVRRGRCHLDSNTPFVEVVESITDVWKEGVVSKDPKTHALRTVQLSPSVAAALRSHIERSGLQGPDSLVFTSPGGSPVHWSNFKNRVWYPALDHVGIRRCKIYALRHTSASLLAAAGVPLHDVKVQLGHSSITTTESYLHFYPQGLEDVAVGMSLSTYKRRDLFGSWCSSYFLSEQEEGRRISESRIDIGT